MSNLSLRGIDPATFADLKVRASNDGGSVNALVLRLIDQGLGRKPGKPVRQRHSDLDALAGSWSQEEAADFEQATAAFAEVDTGLWK